MYTHAVWHQLLSIMCKRISFLFFLILILLQTFFLQLYTENMYVCRNLACKDLLNTLGNGLGLSLFLNVKLHDSLKSVRKYQLQLIPPRHATLVSRGIRIPTASLYVFFNIFFLFFSFQMALDGKAIKEEIPEKDAYDARKVKGKLCCVQMFRKEMLFMKNIIYMWNIWEHTSCMYEKDVKLRIFGYLWPRNLIFFYFMTTNSTGGEWRDL